MRARNAGVSPLSFGQICELGLQLVVRRRPECIPLPRRAAVGAKASKKKKRGRIPPWPDIDPGKFPLPKIPAGLIWKLLPAWVKVGAVYLVYRELTRG